MQQRKAVLAARNADGDPIIRTQHFEAAHGAAHQIQNALFDVHHSSLPITDARNDPL